MLEPIEKLLILQHTDQRITEVVQALKQLPEEKAACEQALRDADKKLEAAQSQQREMELALKKLEGEVLAMQTQVARYRIQQMETRKNEEYKAFNDGIANKEEAIKALEEQQLILMEELELFKEELHLASEVHHLEYRRVQGILGTMEGRHTNLQAREKELSAGRPRLLEGIEEYLLDQYERLFKSKHGTPVVPLEHGVCTGCRLQMTTQTILSTKAEKEIVQCHQCGRFLYTEED